MVSVELPNRVKSSLFSSQYCGHFSKFYLKCCLLSQLNFNMLDFENQMFLDILNEDGLVVAAKGIGLESVFISLLKVYSDAGNLVLVLGTSDKEEDYFINELDSMGVRPLPRLLSSEYSVNDR